MVEEGGPRRAFVIGHPIAHSRSPLIHGTWLARHRIAGSYQAVDVAPAALSAFISALKADDAPFVGGNVTIPHKENVRALCDAVDPLADEIGAVNTLWWENGRLNGMNTDGYGFLANLDHARPGWDATKGSALVLGAGGASRAVIQALRERGFAAIHVVNRTLDRARELADRFGNRIHAHPLEALSEAMAGADLFVNTTSLGMDGSPVPPIDFDGLAEGALVTDIVYVPLVTPLLAMARAQGRPIADGLGMLLHQAVPGFEKWFGIRPAVTEDLRAMIVADMAGHGERAGGR